jgi:hypothetical protein
VMIIEITPSFSELLRKSFNELIELVHALENFSLSLGVLSVHPRYESLMNMQALHTELKMQKVDGLGCFNWVVPSSKLCDAVTMLDKFAKYHEYTDVFIYSVKVGN